MPCCTGFSTEESATISSKTPVPRTPSRSEDDLLRYPPDRVFPPCDYVLTFAQPRNVDLNPLVTPATTGHLAPNQEVLCATPHHPPRAFTRLR